MTDNDAPKPVAHSWTCKECGVTDGHVEGCPWTPSDYGADDEMWLRIGRRGDWPPGYVYKPW
jgi:hypothetical protein